MKINDLNHNVEDLSTNEANSVVGGYTASIRERTSLFNSNKMLEEVFIQPTVSEPVFDAESDRLRRCLISGFC